jgi:hypothetical protein
MREMRIAKGLGWFSIGLGLTELLAPRWLARAIGACDDNTKLMRAFGLREIAAGVAILGTERPTKGLWARVAGDALDIGALLIALGNSFQKGRVAAALGAVVGVTALDAVCARRLSAEPELETWLHA